MKALLVNMLPGIKEATAGRREVWKSHYLLRKKNCSPVLCLSFGKPGRKRGFHHFTKTKGYFFFFLTIMWGTLWNTQSTFFFFKSKLGGNESQLHLWSKPGDIKGIHMTTVHFHTITATVMAVIGWIGPLISLMHPLSPTKLVSASSEIHPFLF